MNFGLPDLVRGLAPATQALSGSRDVPEATPLRTLCRRLGLPHATITDVNGPETTGLLREHGADLILSFHFDQIFDAATLAAAPKGGLNVHPRCCRATAAGADPARAAGGQAGFRRHGAPAGPGDRCRRDPGAGAGDAARGRHRLAGGDPAARGRAAAAGGVLAEAERAGALPEGRSVPVLPYCGFPTPAQLRDLKRRGRRLVDAGI